MAKIQDDLEHEIASERLRSINEQIRRLLLARTATMADLKRIYGRRHADRKAEAEDVA